MCVRARLVLPGAASFSPRGSQPARSLSHSTGLVAQGQNEVKKVLVRSEWRERAGLSSSSSRPSTQATPTWHCQCKNAVDLQRKPPARESAPVCPSAFAFFLTHCRASGCYLSPFYSPLAFPFTTLSPFPFRKRFHSSTFLLPLSLVSRASKCNFSSQPPATHKSKCCSPTGQAPSSRTRSAHRPDGHNLFCPSVRTIGPRDKWTSDEERSFKRRPVKLSSLSLTLLLSLTET